MTETVRYQLRREDDYEVSFAGDHIENLWDTKSVEMWKRLKNENGLFMPDSNEVIWCESSMTISPDSEQFVFAVRELWAMAVFEATELASDASRLVKFAESLQAETKMWFGDDAQAILEDALPRKEVEKAISDLTKSLHDRWLAANDVKNEFYHSRYLK